MIPCVPCRMPNRSGSRAHRRQQEFPLPGSPRVSRYPCAPLPAALAVAFARGFGARLLATSAAHRSAAFLTSPRTLQQMAKRHHNQLKTLDWADRSGAPAGSRNRGPPQPAGARSRTNGFRQGVDKKPTTPMPRCDAERRVSKHAPAGKADAAGASFDIPTDPGDRVQVGAARPVTTNQNGAATD